MAVSTPDAPPNTLDYRRTLSKSRFGSRHLSPLAGSHRWVACVALTTSVDHFSFETIVAIVGEADEAEAIADDEGLADGGKAREEGEFGLEDVGEEADIENKF